MERVLLPLKTITDRFPPPLRAVLAEAPAASVSIAIPVEDILKRLARGRVEISVRELRSVAPANTFVSDTSRDEECVELPLQELLSKLDPTLLKPASQRRIEVPENITSPFNRQASPSNTAATPSTPAPQKEAPAEENPKDKLKKSGLVEASSELQALLAGIKKDSSAAPVPVASPKLQPIPAQEPAKAPAADAKPVKPINLLAPKPQAAQPVPQKRQPIIDAPGIKLREAPPQSPQRPAAPKASATPPALQGNITLPLAKISVGWPETILEETAAYPPDARVEFPAAELAAALRQGKVTVPWQRLRAMIVPQVPKASGDSLYDEALLELPLPVVAPIFMAASNPQGAQQRIKVDESMPALFSAVRPEAKTAPQPTPKAEPKPEPTPQPAPAAPAPKPAPPTQPEAAKPELKAEPAPVSKPAEPTEAAKPPAVPAAPTVPAAQPGALGLDDRIPSELVARACALNGVAGSVVALSDGLLVAATVPPEFKAETIAAFLPQVFSRLEQAAGTMQIGELQTLMFTAGNRPWQIWRAGSLFFAAVGRPNELLPGAQLKIIAAQLARQIKL